MSNDQWPPPIDNTTYQEWKQRIKDLESWSAEYENEVGRQPVMVRIDVTPITTEERFKFSGFGRQVVITDLYALEEAIRHFRPEQTIQDAKNMIRSLFALNMEPPDMNFLLELAEAAEADRDDYRSWQPNKQGYLKHPFDRWRDQLGRSACRYKQFRSNQRKSEQRRNANCSSLPRMPTARNCPPGSNRRPHLKCGVQ